MSDKAYTNDIAKVYHAMLQKSTELMAAIQGKDRDIKDLIRGMQMAHMAIVRRNFEVLQASEPVEKHRTYSQYLREAADLYEAADMAASMEPPQGGPA